MKTTSFEIIFIDDGSTDNSWLTISQLSEKHCFVRGLKFTRNFGHQIAITAGLDSALGNAVITMDCDLQDPPELIPELLTKWRAGAKVVYTIHRDRNEGLFKKWTAVVFYHFFKLITQINAPINSGDYRLMDREVVEQVKSLKETSRYLRGLVFWLGYKYDSIEFTRDLRKFGVGKFTNTKMLTLAMDAITSFSIRPLRCAFYVGGSLSLISLIYLIYLVISKIFVLGFRIQGWTSIMALNSFTFGIMIIFIGLIGEYVGRIYLEVKNRPLYIIESATHIN